MTSKAGYSSTLLRRKASAAIIYLARLLILTIVGYIVLYPFFYMLVYGDLVINTDNRTVLRDCVPVELTPKEFMLLEIFVRNRNITLFRDKIYELVWENDSYGDTPPRLS